MKKNNIIPILLGLVGVGLIVGYFVKNAKKKKVAPEPVPTPSPINPEPKPKVIAGSDVFPIGSGSKGYNVKQLQVALGGKDKLPISFSKGKPDGIFGLETERVLVDQTGKNTVDSMSELEAIANKNGLVKSFTKDGYTFIEKSKQNILAKAPKKSSPF